MKLPHLDQIVLLERGEAGLLARALHVLVQDVTAAKRPVPPGHLLTCAPLATLAQRLDQVHQREQLSPRRPGRRPKPRRLRVPYDQLLAVLHHRWALGYCGLSAEEQLLLPGLVGKFQQQALNLARWVRFASTSP
jgi:hypothetical protein